MSTLELALERLCHWVRQTGRWREGEGTRRGSDDLISDSANPGDCCEVTPGTALCLSGVPQSLGPSSRGFALILGRRIMSMV